MYAPNSRFSNTDKVEIKGPGTDISFSIKGIGSVKCDGRRNIPDGEVFTGPVEKSVNGHIRFSFPTVRQGREATDVRLEFKDGKVVKSEASKGLDYLREMIDMDAGSATRIASSQAYVSR